MTKKRVRISEETSSDEIQPALSDQERENAFWSPGEFARAREDLKRICREHRNERRYSDILTEAYQQASNETSSNLPPPMELPRGLEGYASRLHAIRRQGHLRDARHAVLVEQARQTLIQDYQPELLAERSAEASLRARQFAVWLGQADAKEVLREERGVSDGRETMFDNGDKV